MYNIDSLFDEMHPNSCFHDPQNPKLTQRDQIYKDLTRYRKSLVLDIVQILNDTHKLDFSTRHWEIVIGDWLIRAIDALHHRFEIIKSAVEENKFSSIHMLTDENVELAPTDSFDAIHKLSNPFYNSRIFASILNHFQGTTNIPVIRIDCSSTDVCLSTPYRENRSPLTLMLTQRIWSLLSKLFTRSEDILIANSYLPLRSEIALNLSYFQFPAGLKAQCSAPYNRSKDPELRSDLTAKLMTKAGEGFDRVVRALIFELLPKSYLESFKEYAGASDKSGWPSRPKAIFTSNNYDFDDVFKIYVANNVYRNMTKYVVGCHGAGFQNFVDNPSNAESVADVFITWGWKESGAQYYDGFVFKTARRTIKKRKATGLLLIIPPLLHNVYAFDVYQDCIRETHLYISFLKILRPEILKNTTLRMHGQDFKTVPSREALLRKRFPDLEIVSSANSSLDGQKKAARLVVYGYNSSGFAESLSLNEPCKVFLPLGLDTLPERDKKIFKALSDLAVAFESIEELAVSINTSWEVLNDQWWSADTQSALRNTTHEYARYSDTPVRDIRNIFDTLLVEKI